MFEKPQYYIDNRDNCNYDWNRLITNVQFTERQLYKIKDILPWKNVSKYQSLSPDFIDLFSLNLYWPYILKYQNVPEYLIEKYGSKLDWKNDVSLVNKLSEKFIIEHHNKLSPINISKYQTLSEKFIRQYKDEVSWFNITIYQKLSEEFIEEFASYVCFYMLPIYQNLSHAFIKKYLKYLDWDMLILYEDLNDEIIHIMADVNINKINWKLLQKEQHLSPKILNYYRIKLKKL